ncbi:MAG: hypothetical protein KF774_15960 [Planctomyces sp.]|nr:hypothetical protein [Planctomyces sp.]
MNEKKQIERLRTKLQLLQRQLAGARKQCDDPQEVAQLEKEIATARAELQRLEQD